MRCYTDRYMISKFKNLIVSLLSLLVIVMGGLGILVVLDFVTWEQVWVNLATLLQIGAIILIVSVVLVLLLNLNKR